MNSANARGCLQHLTTIKLSENKDLVHLNDQFIDIIEHVHYVEAEHAALEHDYNLLKTGIQTDSSSINELFEVEIRNVRVGVEDINRNRQQLLIDERNLALQAQQAEQQWRHLAQEALGVPKEVDEEFKRMAEIKSENCVTLRRIKYVEDKNRILKQKNGRIYEQVNLMRMRKDQAVSLHHEYILRKNELLNSIRTMQEDNKAIIMNEHKYFTRDRTVDRHVFRDQLRQSIADIRADYEFKRTKNEEEIRTHLEREIARINENPIGNITWQRIKEEVVIVKESLSKMQNQNAALSQQIEMFREEVSENHQAYEISLDLKTKETNKLKEQCTSISLELEKLCDLNIDLNQEIARYRELLDRKTVSVHVQQNFPSSPNLPNIPPIRPTGHRFPAPIHPLPSISERTPGITHASSSEHRERTVSQYSTHDRRSPAPIHPLPSLSESSESNSLHYTRTGQHSLAPVTPLPTSSEHRERTISQYSTHERRSPAPIHPLPSLSESSESNSLHYTRTGQHSLAPVTTLPTSSEHRESTTHQYSTSDRRSPAPILPRLSTFDNSERTVPHYPNIGRAPYTTGPSLSDSSQSTVRHYSDIEQTHIQHVSSTSNIPTSVQATRPFESSESIVRPHSSSDRLEEDNFQRFTRWYKSRVKISDVTPDFVQLVNRSSQKSVNIGGFRVIHEFGFNNVYVDLPAGLILAPKESFKIYARKSAHERGAVVLEIDNFDTSVNSHTSIRDTKNEVKSWFVYTSNTEIGDHHH
uniref:LTD domain-containing protein n=1 Tax=Caenorhabditis japonica TaxID=281687 RepID=A0A8R1I266_CAEJA